MSEAILNWLGGRDTGASSKVLALTALGAMPDHAATSYPHDGADFGRCYRLIQAAPETREGLEKLSTHGGPYWKALAGRWNEIEAAYVAEAASSAGGATYDLMRSILEPIERSDRGFVRLGPGVSMRIGA